LIPLRLLVRRVVEHQNQLSLRLAANWMSRHHDSTMAPT
jgi:hypothetical protein